MPRAFSEAQKELIRARLIEAGKRSLNRSGVRGVVIDEIAREARVSKGSFYAFFPSREDFIISVFESWEACYRGRLFADVMEGKGSPRQRLKRFFSEAVTLLEKEPGLARLGLGEIEDLKAGLPPERLALHQAADAKAAQEAMSAWSEAGLVSPDDIPAFGGIAISLFLLAINRENFPEGSFEPAMALMAEALAERFAKGGRHAGRQ